MEPTNLLQHLASECRDLFRSQQVILSLPQFMDLVRTEPRKMMRSAPEYLRDVFQYFGKTPSPGLPQADLERFKLFDLHSEKSIPIVGGETVHHDIFRCLQGFVWQGTANKMIFLHGPNGSAKSSTVEAISLGMQRYSETEEGAVYRFNWIFPVEKSDMPRLKGETGPIGFSKRESGSHSSASYAFLADQDISCKITSEFKENPLYLIPMPHREKILRDAIATQENIRPEDVEIPPHMLLAGLSKRNQLIFENLFAAYDGDLEKVLRHVQVERFFYSRQYHVGISSIEPQMSIDATEKQLTMDRHIANLPPILHNIRFHESFGELVEANRGLLEFSDLLKRPVEAFKYLLTTVEKATLSLPSATQHLDIVFFATANDKHLDSFKTLPDFSSFRARFELITVPYLLSARQECKIYGRDVDTIKKFRPVAPHALEMLSLWAVMTRLKQPDPEHYEGVHRPLIARLDPFSKACLYDGRPLQQGFNLAEETVLRSLRGKIIGESVGMVVYEGRFGASPREIRTLLYRVAEDTKHRTITPMTIFEELERIVRDRTTYEFLQFEPRHKYHDAPLFIRFVKEYFAQVFEEEVLSSMTLVEQQQYDQLLARYIEHVVADIKKERLFNKKTEGYEQPSGQLMKDIETILGIQGAPEKHRESLLSRIGSWRVEHPKDPLNFSIIFQDLLQRIKDHYYAEKSRLIETNLTAMLAVDSDTEKLVAGKDLELARHTYQELERRYGYDPVSARECVKFLVSFRRAAAKR